MESSLRCFRGCRAAVALCFVVMFGEGLVLSGERQGGRNASNALVQLNGEAPDLGDFCNHAGHKYWYDGFTNGEQLQRQYVQLKGYWFSGGRRETPLWSNPGWDTYTGKCDDYSGLGLSGYCPGFGSHRDGTDGEMNFWISTRGIHSEYQWPEIHPKHDWTICVVKDWYDELIRFPADAHACSYFTTSDACPCVWTGSECQKLSQDVCFEAGTRYSPSMSGQGRSVESSPSACQQRCASVTGCAHFSFWPDGGCHLQDANASAMAESGVTAGPRTCEGESLWFVGRYRDQGEGEVYSNEAAARDYFNALYGGPWPAVLYDQDLTAHVRYGVFGQDVEQAMLDWAALERKHPKQQVRA